MTDDTAVKVVVRIRPQTSRDIADLCHVCTKTIPNEPQIWIGSDKSYTFDQVFNTETLQDEIFDTRVAELVDGCFDGYNATVLAYGQTGSGKTYTMGTGFDHSFHLDQRGIIPRAIERLFRKIECIQNDEKEKGCVPPDIKVHVQFLELYNEEVIDLLNSSQEYDDKNKQHIKIHEKNGEIYAQGVHIQCVTNIQEALQCLKVGSLSRTTASTGMNVQSSRSHAIFSLHIKQQRVVKLGKAIAGDDNCNSTLHSHSDSLSEFETLTAKFHFVDLAGSERLKRTGATGDRQKESISINSGLLALGNVISALGDKSKKATHVPYRDSKLTRLLQDSLGGNSRTLMIACVSPSDRDFVETLSTLKYANRAKNIRNKVMANMDKSSQTIKSLLDKVESLQMELLEFKQGKRLLRDDGEECINDMYHENNMLQSENNSLKTRIKALQETIDRLTSKNSALLVEKESEEWAVNGTGTKREISTLIQGYVSEIESLRAKLIEYEEVCALLRKSVAKTSPFSPYSVSTVAITGHYDIRVETPPSLTDLLAEARKDVKKRKKRINKLEGHVKGNVIEECDEDMKAIEENDNFEDDQNEEDSSSDSEMEKADQNEKLSDNLAEISCDISLKEKLIRQLEISQKRLHNMRQHYEEKISQLQSKILEAEKERDRIISNLSKTSESKSEEKRIRADYEKKISCLRNDVKNFENAKKHHVQLVASASNYENQLKKLKQEVAEMKKTKITLLNKMKEETKKHKDFELKQNKEIAVLRKEKLNKESQIKALEAEKKRKEIVLKKRTEEIINLKKRVGRTMSPRNVKMMKAGPVLKAAKQAWQSLEKKINKLVLNHQNIAAIVKDMNKFLKDREKIGRSLEKVNRKRDAAIRAFKGSKVIEEFDDEIENLKANIEYIHDNLSACQSALTGLEESKENVNYNDIVNTLNNMRLDESYYIIEKIVLLAIEQSFQNSQKELLVKDLETQLAQTTENNTFADQLLFHVVQRTDLHELVEHTAANVKESDISESDSESRSSSPDESLASFSRESTFVSDKPRRTKARNIAATTEQLLFSSIDPAIETPNPPSQQSEFERVMGFSEAKSLSYVILPSSKEDTNGNQIDNEIPSHEKTYTIHDYMPITNVNGRPSSYLACSTMFRGHKLPVTDVTCTNDVLFSSSEDGVVKIWDLATFTEIQKLSHINHIKNKFDSIKKICYCEYTRRAFSASSSEITVWDVRQNPAPILQKLRNTGTTSDLRLDSQINDISLNPYGTLLYAASSRAVTIWDLRNFQCIGALDLGHGFNVTHIDVSDIELQRNRIICGTENKAIKVFEVEEDACGLQYPKYNLTPPHDIKSLTTRSSTLLTSSNDLTITKWNLNKRIVEHTFKAAQDSPICSLNILQDKPCFLSGSVSGCLKLWSLSNCTSLEEIQAHQSSINSIASNSSHIFTASSDNLIGVWRLKRS